MSDSSYTIRNSPRGREQTGSSCLALDPGELQELLHIGSGKARELFRTIATGSQDELKGVGVTLGSRIGRDLRAPDGSRKFQVILDDDSTVETVMMTDRSGRRTLCISSQVGCTNRCAFCRTGMLEFRRNLTASEIIAQYHLGRWLCGTPSNVVFMGMGEPLVNFDEVVRAASLLMHPIGAAIAPRRVTISTSGIPLAIRRYADQDCPARLALSLVTADPLLRAGLFPGTTVETVKQLREAMLYLQTRRRQRVTLEIVLLGGLNDGPEQPPLIRDFVENMDAHVNVIPWNAVARLGFREPEPKRVRDFAMQLALLGIPTTTRMSRGRDVSAACGQLGLP
ncbi:MAG TPA: radical SAM protein [Spirochaetia bacterium]|nr:radical SAM protein [Spirochaetia bacterium]